MIIKELYDPSEEMDLQDCEIRIFKGYTFERYYDLKNIECEWNPEMKFVILH